METAVRINPTEAGNKPSSISQVARLISTLGDLDLDLGGGFWQAHVSNVRYSNPGTFRMSNLGRNQKEEYVRFQWRQRIEREVRTGVSHEQSRILLCGGGSH